MGSSLPRMVPRLSCLVDCGDERQVGALKDAPHSILQSLDLGEGF